MSLSSAFEKKIGQLIVVGFHGTRPEDAGVQRMLEQVAQGQVGGVALFRYNIESKQQLETLIAAFLAVDTELPLLIGVDQEGGKVQRLSSTNGFSDFHSAKHVANTLSINEALTYYQSLGQMLGAVGINFDWAPCVDVDDTPGCPVIGGIERSYSSAPETVVNYASAMLEGLRSHGVIGCLKHFPGHGRVGGDTHEGLVEITESWSELELEPYRQLIARGGVDCVMSAHLVHQTVDPDIPATLSKKWLDRLRHDFAYDGVIISDCLHMGAMVKHFPLPDVVVRGLNAGLDMLLFSNNPLAAAEAGIRHASDAGDDYVTLEDWRVPDPELPITFKNAVLQAIEVERLDAAVVEAAYERVVALKSKLTKSA